MSAKPLVLLAAALATAAPAAPRQPAPPPASDWTAACTDFDEWDKAGPPFRVYGNTYYVGTCGIAAILITGSKGHILIDGATAKGGAMIAANITRLGFRLKDVKVLLHSHEHLDHVGGTALLQQLSGAKLIASAEAAPVLASGKDTPADPQSGMHAPFAPARVDRVLAADGKVALGNLRLTAIRTPGHTPGALSWQWRSCRAGGRECRTLVYADSLNPISNTTYRFSDHPEYLTAFYAGVDRVAALDCDLLLTPHPVSSDMRARMAGSGLIDPSACRRYAATIRQRLDDRVIKERADAGS